MRAVRSDKLTLAALEATLQQHLAGITASDIPVARMIAAPLESLRARAKVWAEALADLASA